MELNHRSPGCHPGVFTAGPRDHVVSDRGGGRTHKITRLSTSPLCQFAYPVIKWRVRGSHPAGSAYEAGLSTGPPATTFSCKPRYRTGLTGLMRASWAPAAPAIRVTKGRVELPRPAGHDVLSVACLPIPPLRLFVAASQKVRRAGVEPAKPEGGWVTATGARQCPADACSSDTGGSRTHNHQGLSLAALPVGVPCLIHKKRPRWDLNPRPPR